MSQSPQTPEKFTIRRKVFKIFGAGFHIYGRAGDVIGYCKQKAFRLKEDLRIYTSDGMQEELFRIGARSIIDFGATYEVSLPTGEVLGTFRRKGLKSFVRDTWLIFDGQGNEIGQVLEDSTAAAVFRRFLGDYSFLFPQRLHIDSTDGRRIATYRTHFNPFIHRLGVAIHEEDETIDELVILAGGCLLGAIEQRQ